jgi:hypothetical protein
MAKMSDVIEASDIFNNAKIEVNIDLSEEEYHHVLSNFREMDRDKEQFTIEISENKFNFRIKS